MTQDDADALEVAGTSEEHRAAATRLMSLATERHPDDEVTTADLLVRAGEELGLAGDHRAAVDLCRRAVADGGEVDPDPRCYLLAGLLVLEETDEADALAAEIRRSRPASGFVYQLVGESYEQVGQHETARRWYTMGLSRLPRTPPTSADDDVRGAARDVDRMMLGAARARVGAALGYPADDLDEEYHEQHAAFEDLLDRSR